MQPFFVHLSYLQQVSELLEDRHKSQAARLGHIARQICEKHVVHINGADPPKLRRCKACQGPITCDNVRAKKGKKILVECSLCGQTRTYDKVREGAPGQTEPITNQVLDRILEL